MVSSALPTTTMWHQLLWHNLAWAVTKVRIILYRLLASKSCELCKPHFFVLKHKEQPQVLCYSNRKCTKKTPAFGEKSRIIKTPCKEAWGLPLGALQDFNKILRILQNVKFISYRWKQNLKMEIYYIGDLVNKTRRAILVASHFNKPESFSGGDNELCALAWEFLKRLQSEIISPWLDHMCQDGKTHLWTSHSYANTSSKTTLRK